MNYGQLSARLELLFNQQRYEEAEHQLHGYLEEFPSDQYAQYMLAVTFFSQNKLDQADQVLNLLIEDNPAEHGYLALSARIDIAREFLAKAEEKIEILLSADSQDPEHYNLMATVKFKQRNYDRALWFAERALSIDPENLQALNLRTTVSGILGHTEAANISIKEALQQDPENDWTIANYGQQLLREGRVEEALDQFKDSLSKNPNNELAQYGLKEALKSRFWPYKIFYKYQMFMSRLTSRQMWGLMIGAFFTLRILGQTAERNPELAVFLNPVIYLVVAVFLSTWIIQPLMNLYLLTNKYGKLLLDDHDKQSAKYVGISLLLALVGIAGSLILGVESLMIIALFFVALMIPLGTMFHPPTSAGRKKTVYFTIGIVAIGLIGFFLKLGSGSDLGIIIALGGIFVYQWFLNGIMIRAGSRMMD